jgi:hypothetical protein
MTIAADLRDFISSSADDVFVRSEFATLGSAAQVGRALSGLVDAGLLVRLGVGVYARAKQSVLSGKPIPAKPLEVLAPLALTKLGVPTRLGRLARMYNDGSTLQVPPGIVLDVGSRRVSRRLGFGNKVVEYETGQPLPREPS